MKRWPLIVLAGLFLGVGPSLAAPAGTTTLSVCRVSAEARDWVGKRIVVQGYIVDLGSHGFALVSGRECKTNGQLALFTGNVGGSAIWQKAFTGSIGPKHAVLIGVVRWERARVSGHVPALEVEQVASIANHEADLSKVSQ
jgi:hypothetical protein